MGEILNDGGSLVVGVLLLYSITSTVQINPEYGCPLQEKILPCRCSTREMEYQIWCSHSELPKVLEGIREVSHYITQPIDELILENNNLPSLPGQVFANLKVLRLMLRNNRLERVSSSWLEGLHDFLLELFIVEPDLRSLPDDSLENFQSLEAITLQSKVLKRLPSFSGLPKLRYLQVNSPELMELVPRNFRELPSFEQIHVFGSAQLSRLEAGLFRNLPRLTLVNITDCRIHWIHPRAMIGLPELKEVSLAGNSIMDAGMVGRVAMDLSALSVLQLDRNQIIRLGEASFTNLPTLTRLSLSRNRITEIFLGAFHRVPLLRMIDLSHNLIHRIHPEFFSDRGESSLEEIWLRDNDLNHVSQVRSVLQALPRLKFLDVSQNQLEEISFGEMRGHSTLEKLYLDHNRLRFLQRESFSGMPALRELRLRNNSLTNLLDAPFWNLPALKGLDLSGNYFRHIEPRLLINIPNLRRLDMSLNALSLIEPQSFLETPVLEHINISGNALSVIHPMTFRHLTNLHELDIGWNRLLAVVPGLPRNIEHLYLPMNRIVALPGLSSQDLVLPILRNFDIAANGIEKIPPGTLSGLASLRNLNLGHNALRIIEDGTFDGLRRLEQLDLRYNRLSSIHGRSFKTLGMLMDLNLKGNRLEIIRPDIFQDNGRLQKLDISRNNLAQIPHATFADNRGLRELYASYNTLTELPRSLHDLTALQVLDLSFNKLNSLSSDTLSSLTSLLELRLARNRIRELKDGAFDRLPRLAFIDLENNNLQLIERNAIRALPELQVLKLGKNHVQMIPIGAFLDLPLLQSVEFQENQIQEIANDAFINVPHLLFLNLSHNLLPGLEYIGLDSLKSLEVLDLSNNQISKVTSDSLKAMEWLIELKLDNNRICTIRGSPFDDMPRLRVLSLRNNRMASVTEDTFKRLRSNIAVLDIDGNPLSCSCGMLWLRGWLQQASVEGPRCADGSLFKQIRLSRQDCQRQRYEDDPVYPGCESEMIKDHLPGLSPLYGIKVAEPWMNIKHENSQVKPYDVNHDYSDHMDYSLRNATYSITTPHSPILIPASPPPKTIETTPKASHPNNTITPTKKNPPIPPSPSSSGFTFFGVPLPNLNFNLWGNSGRKSERKGDFVERSEKNYNKDLPPTKPEIQRGGFIPITQGEKGFVPISDSHIRNEKEKNATSIIQKIPKIRGNTTMFKTHEEQRKIEHANYTTLEKIEEISSPTRERFGTKDQSGVTIISSDTNHLILHSTTLGSSQKNSTSFKEPLTIVGKPNEKASEIPASMQIDVRDNVEIGQDAKERDPSAGGVNGVILRKSVLETVGVDTEKAGIELVEKNIVSLKKKDETQSEKTTTVETTISQQDDLEKEKDVTTESPALQSSSLVTIQITEKLNSTQKSIRDLEASALSTFLVPGGQISFGTSGINSRPSGRSTIVKVLSNPTSGSLYSVKNSGSGVALESDQKSIENNAFNWYFEQYNNTHLDPFIGIIYSGVYHSNLSKWIFLGTQVVIFCRIIH